MIFAELEYPEPYSDFHDELVEYLRMNFPDIQYGHQSDSWIWITYGHEKVEVDTFTSNQMVIQTSGRCRAFTHRGYGVADKRTFAFRYVGKLCRYMKQTSGASLRSAFAGKILFQICQKIL